jgi:hypothetical protein
MTELEEKLKCSRCPALDNTQTYIGNKNPNNHVENCETDTYIITHSGATYQFTNRLCNQFQHDERIEDALSAIKSNAGNKPITIQFGESAAPLQITSSEAVEFSGDWGHITLTGGITSAAANLIVIKDNVNITSTADITNNNSNAASRAISHEGTGILAIEGGTVSATSGRAIENVAAGRINISEKNELTTLITSGITTGTAGTIALLDYSGSGDEVRLEITGGTVRNTGTASGTGNASNVIYNDSTSTINISGENTVVEATGGSANRAILNNNKAGTINIKNGVKVTANGSSSMIINYGIINIYNSNVSAYGSGNAITNNADSTITIEDSEISANTSSTATIQNYGIMNINNSAISSMGTAGNYSTVYNRPSAVLTVKDSVISATGTYNTIYNYAEGTMDVTNSTISSASRNAIYNLGAVTISGEDSVIETKAAAFYGVNQDNDNAALTVYNGKISAATETNAVNNTRNTNVTIYEPPTVLTAGAANGRINTTRGAITWVDEE